MSGEGGLQSHHGSEDLLEVNAMLLQINFSMEPCFVLDNGADRILFLPEDLFHANGVVASG